MYGAQPASATDSPRQTRVFRIISATFTFRRSRLVDVGQRPDRLQRPVSVGAVAQVNELPGRELRGEQRLDHLVPLERVHREPVVAGRVSAGRHDPLGERGPGHVVQLGGEQRVRVQLRYRLEGAELGGGREPDQPELPRGLGGVARGVGGGEPEPALVQEDARVAGLVPLEVLVRQLGQLGGGQRPVPQPHVGDLGGDQVAHQLGQHRPAQPDRLAQIQGEPHRIARRLDHAVSVPRHRAGHDPPGAERPPPGPERVGDTAGQLDPPAIAGRLGTQQFLVRQLLDHPAQQRAPSPVPLLVAVGLCSLGAQSNRSWVGGHSGALGLPNVVNATVSGRR